MRFAKKVSAVVDDELYAAKRELLAQESIVEHNQHALDVAKAKCVMLRNRVKRLQAHMADDGQLLSDVEVVGLDSDKIEVVLNR